MALKYVYMVKIYDLVFIFLLLFKQYKFFLADKTFKLVLNSLNALFTYN